MKKDSKQRLFEVMGRLDKSFKPKLNEDFGNEIPADDTLANQIGNDEPVEKTPEEKLQELTTKVDEMYALLHGEEQEVPEAGEENDEENLQEWNFDKKKDDKKEDKEEKDEKPKGKTQFNFDKKDDDKESETPEDEKEEIDEAKPKLPVAAIAKVGK